MYKSYYSRGVTNERQLVVRMNEFWRQMLHENKNDIFARQVNQVESEPGRISGLEAEISQLEEQPADLSADSEAHLKIANNFMPKSWRKSANN